MTRGLVAALMGLPAVLQAQAAPAPGYRAGAACVAYAERADARVLSTVGGTVHEGGTGRAGVLVVRLLALVIKERAVRDAAAKVSIYLSAELLLIVFCAWLGMLSQAAQSNKTDHLATLDVWRL